MIRGLLLRITWLVLWAHLGWSEGRRMTHDPGVAYGVAVALLILGVILADALWLPSIEQSLAMRFRGRGVVGPGSVVGAPRSAPFSAPEVDQPRPMADTGPGVVAPRPTESGSRAPVRSDSVLPESLPTAGLGGAVPPFPAGGLEGDGAGLVPPRPPGAPASWATSSLVETALPPGFAMGLTLVRERGGKSEGKIIELDPRRKISRAEVARWQGEGWVGVEAIPPEFIE